MDTSVAVDLSGWLAGTSDILYVVSFCTALLVVVLVGCMVRQSVAAVGHSDTPKRSAHLAR